MSLPTAKSLLVILLLGQPVLSAAQNRQIEHEHLLTDAELGFTEVLAQALEHAPQALEQAVRQEQADAYSSFGRSWLAGRPSLNLSLIDDGLRSNTGLQEQEYGIQLPLWRPGERRDTAALGQLYQGEVPVWLDYLRWQLAGQVRTLLADLEAREVAMELEQAAQARANELRDITQNMYEAGAVSRLDVMQAETLALEHQKKVLEVEAEMVDAEREYAVVTGLEVRPASRHRETLSSLEEPVADHPLLLFMASQVNLADAGIRQSEINSKGNPQLTIGTRRERPDQFQPWIDSVGISLTIPFGGRSAVSSRSSAARMQKVDAEVQLLSARRMLDRDIHEAEHGLFITTESLPLSRRRHELASENSVLARNAFTAGELTLAQVILVLQQELEAERELRMLELQEQRQIAEYNHLIGVMP